MSPVDTVTPPAVPAPAKLLLTFAEAAELLNLSRSLLYEMDADGRLGPLPVRFPKTRKALLRAKELTDWVDAGCPGRTKWLALQAGPALRLAGGGR